MILAMCCAGPMGKPATAGNAAKTAVAQARPAKTTSTPPAQARWNAPIPILPTILAAASTSVASSIAMPSIGTTPFERSAALSTVLSMSARSTPMRKLSPSSRAISRMIASVCSRCGLAPADPAEPMMRGIFSLRAASITLRGSRRVQQARSRARRCQDNRDRCRSIPCRNRSDAAFAQVLPKMPASARRIRAAQRRQEFGSVPNRSLWKNGPISARTRSYLKLQERRVPLRTIDVTVAGGTPHDLTRQHDLDRTAERVVDHRDRVDCHAVKWRHLLSNERFRLGRPLIIRLAAEDDIQGDATRAGVLAAHYLREVLKLHGLFRFA